MFPGHDRVFLAWSRIVGGHSPDGRLGVREDGDGAKRMVSGCLYSERRCCTSGLLDCRVEYVEISENFATVGELTDQWEIGGSDWAFPDK